MYELITPESCEYASARLIWNRAYDLYPDAIAYCSTENEVKKAIQMARSLNRNLRIRGGGHNYVGTSVGNDTFVIDISNMNQIEMDLPSQTVRVQGGTQLGQIYSQLGAKEYPFPGGSCSAVGISGVVSGGGWGYSSRYLGLACDSVLEARVIDESGCTLIANETKHKDLFWAIRGGGGGNFGVITSLTFQLPEKVSRVTYFTITYDQPDPEVQVQFLDAWQNWIVRAPDAINMKASLVNSAEDGIQIRCTGLLYGTEQQLPAILSVFAQIPGYQMMFQEVSFLQAFQIITSVYPVYEHFIPYARFVSCKYSKDTLLSLVQRINGPRPAGSTLTEVNVYGLGGKAARVAPQDTAFFYRKSSYILLIETVFEDNCVEAVNRAWVEQNAAFLYGITNGSYINFPYLPLPDALVDYYGGNLSCLQQIKYQYDPENVFHFPQSIR